MSALAERAGAAAVARVVDAMVALVVDEVPDISAERMDAGLRLSGPRLAIRRVEDVRLRGLAQVAARIAR